MEKINYDKIYQRTVEGFGGEKRTLLLHCCCAPCAVSTLAKLKDYFVVTLYFFNPNIDTEEEYFRRANELYKLSSMYDIKDTIIEDYDPSVFYAAARGLESEPEGGARCPECFALRLRRTAAKANELKADYFGTTLTVSPHKNSYLVNAAGEAAQSKACAKYLYSDFKKREGYKLSGALSEKIGLYRQNYCGCEFAKICR